LVLSLVVALLVVSLPLNAAPARPVATAPETLRIGIGVRPDTLEISQATNAAVANLLENVVETLVTVDENGQIAPQLAERWEVSPNGREYTFHLAQGVSFQDGTPLNAAAVVWNYDRLKLIEADVSDCVAAEQLAPVESVKAIDANTVRYTLSRPIPTFLGTVSWVAFGILSPRSDKVFGNQKLNIQHPVGTGPFTIEKLSADQLELRRFDGYRGERPSFGKLAFKFITSPQEREKGLANNQLDVILLPSAKQLPALAKNARYEVVSRPSSRTIFVNLNNQKAPFNDVRVRRAVNMAIDKQALIEQVLHGAGTVMDSPLAAGIAGYCSVGSYDYNPAAARALLAEAKVAPGTRLTMLTPKGRYLEDEAVANKIAGYLREVGFAVTVKALDWPAMMGELYRPPAQVTADMHLFGWAPTFPDAAGQLPMLYQSKEWPPFGPASTFYKNPQVDRLLDQAVLEAAPGTRNDLFCQAEKAIWNDAPAIFLWAQSFPVTFREGLTNIVSLPSEKVQVAFAKRGTAKPVEKPVPQKGKSR